MVDYSDRPERMGYDVLGDTIAKAVMTFTRAMEPKLNELAAQTANRAVHQGQRVARNVYRRVREEPWYLIGAAAILLVTAAIFFRLGSRGDEYEIEDPLDRQLH